MQQKRDIAAFGHQEAWLVSHPLFECAVSYCPQSAMLSSCWPTWREGFQTLPPFLAATSLAAGRYVCIRSPGAQLAEQVVRCTCGTILQDPILLCVPFAMSE